jgi:hypothetical protein
MKQTLIAIDQLINTLAGGYCDETISARCYRNRNKTAMWRFFYRLINLLFFWQSDHCMDSYHAEINRQQLPSIYRQ